jgi:hypothetical protein
LSLIIFMIFSGVIAGALISRHNGGDGCNSTVMPRLWRWVLLYQGMPQIYLNATPMALGAAVSYAAGLSL